MDTIQIVILAVVQGIAEFLPISSSGHLVILSALMAGGDTEALDVADVNIVLHVGTLLSILVVYFHRIQRLLGQDRRVVMLLAIATIPAVVVGVPIKKWGSQAILENPLLAGVMLIVTGTMLLWAARRQQGSAAYTDLSPRKAGLIGLAQAFAILPGISRSGATITAGIASGMTRRAAATFSFLMAIPVIAGAGLLELKDLLKAGSESGTSTSLSLLLLGAAVAFLVGLVSLLGLLRCLERGRLQWFAYWCIPVGLAVVVWQLLT